MDLRRRSVVIAAFFLLIASIAESQSTAVHRELVPTGRLRVGINIGNALLATKDAAGTTSGIAVDLARELARRLNVAMDIVTYESAGQMADAANKGGWDVAFLATDPARGNEILFSPPYLEIESTYLVPANSPLRTIADVDRDGVRIAVSDKSAYDLFLTRALKQARLVRVPGVNPSVDLFFQQNLEALAGLRPLLVEVAQKHAGTRVMDGRFTVVEQAIGTPQRRVAGAKYLSEFVEDVKASGLVARVIGQNGIRGVSVAPLRRNY